MEENSGWIDVSVPLKTGMVHYPGDPPVNISRSSGNDQEDPIVSHLSLCAHAGTHVDAPLHYLKNGKSIDRIQIDAMIGPSRVIHISDTAVIAVRELERRNISRGERILFKTRNSALWKSDIFFEDYVYLSNDAAAFLVEKGVITVGIDYFSIAGFKKNELEVHKMLLEAGIWVIESLNLSTVDPGWYDLICLPLLIAGAEAAPARAMIRPAANHAGRE